MFPARIRFMLASAGMVALTALGLDLGCAPETTEFDKAVNYTPETLAQEFIVRYRALRPAVQTAKPRPTVKKAQPPDSTAVKKSEMAPAKNKTAPTTIDDLMEDINHKITLLKGMSATEVTKKMIDTISRDTSLRDPEKKTLTELLENPVK